MGRGKWGEGFSGTTIKDTWTKPSGRVEVGEGGGLAGWVVGWMDGEKMQTTVIEQQFKKRNNITWYTVGFQ